MGTETRVIKDHQDRNNGLYDRDLDGYGPERLEFLRKRTFESHGSFLFPYLKPQYKVLDCGCGPGTISLGIAKRIPQGSVTCCDVSMYQLEETQLRARCAGVSNIHTVQQDVCALGFESETFDIVFANALIEHLLEPAEAALEMWRVLRPGGALALRSPDWTAIQLSPSYDVASLCVEAFAERLHTRRVLAETGGLAPLFKGLRLSAINRSTSMEVHSPAGLFTNVIIASLSVDGGTSLTSFSSALAGLRLWGCDPISIAVEKWDEIILVKETSL